MKTVSNSKLKKAVKLAIAIHAYNAVEGITARELGLTDDQFEVMSTEAHKISERLAGGHPMNIGSVSECIEYFKNWPIRG